MIELAFFRRQLRAWQQYLQTFTWQKPVAWMGLGMLLLAGLVLLAFMLVLSWLLIPVMLYRARNRKTAPYRGDDKRDGNLIEGVVLERSQR